MSSLLPIILAITALDYRVSEESSGKHIPHAFSHTVILLPFISFILEAGGAHQPIQPNLPIPSNPSWLSWFLTDPTT